MMAFNNKDNDQILEFIDGQDDWQSIRISEDKESFLHIGIFSDNYSICKALLMRKLDVNWKNKEGHTPLHSAAIQKSNWKFVELLMKFKSNPTIRDIKGKTPLHHIRWITCLNIILKEFEKKEEEKLSNLINISDDQGNTPLVQAILDYGLGNVKIQIVKELIKRNSDYSITNKNGDNALHISARQKNSNILGMIILKMLNDELNNKTVGKDLLSSQGLLNLQNKSKDDVLIEAINAKSKEWVSILLEVANMQVNKEHISLAKSYRNENSKIYSLLKKYQEQEGNNKNNNFLGFKGIDNSKNKQSRNHLNGMKSSEEIRGKVTDYFMKNTRGSKKDLLSTSEAINFEETKATNHLKDTLEKLTIERDIIRDDRDKLLQLLDENDDWNYKLSEEEIEVKDQIGWGAYAVVYKADYYGTDVAVKRFNKSDEKSLKIYANEVKVLKSCHHPNVLRLIGYYETDSFFNIVTEFLPWGNLSGLIHTKKIQFPIKRKLMVAIEIAKVMNYLHSRKRPVLHRDLKSENILIDKSLRIKLCDFGISKMSDIDEVEEELQSPININKQTKTIGTVSWMSPEFINDKISSKKSDVYSFGILFWEILTRDKLYPDLQPIQIAYGVANNNLRPPIPKNMNKKAASLMKRCWEEDPDKRPWYKEILERLLEIQNELVVH